MSVDDRARSAPRVLTSTRRAFVLRRLHSLTGVLPLGVFLVEHLWTNAAILRGPGAFVEAVRAIQALPFLPALEWGGIFLPLLYHALYGLVIARSSRPALTKYPYASHWLYALQRLTGIFAFVFIVVHLWQYRVPKALGRIDADSFAPALMADLSATHGGIPWMAMFYVLGLASTVFHFANGLVGFSITWGLVQSRVASRRVGWIATVLGVALFVTGLLTVTVFSGGPL